MVAATGALLVGFLLVHAIGNLLILKGPEALNGYADWLQGHPLLWGFRVGLLLLVAIHVAMTIRLARENRAARPVDYRILSPLGVRLPGRLMLISGLTLLAFLVLHLLHLTVRSIGPTPEIPIDAEGRLDVYMRLVASFNDPIYVIVYLSAMALLALHLWHALESLFQTLGFNHESYRWFIRYLAPALGVVIAAGFAAIPLLIFAGVIGVPHG